MSSDGVSTCHGTNRRTRSPSGFLILFSFSLLLGACSCTAPASVPDHLHYRISATLDPPAQSIEASADLSFPSPSSDLQSAEFLLHRQLSITAIDGPAVSGYQFDTVYQSPIPWVPEAGRLEVFFDKPLDQGEVTDIHFEYRGVIESWSPWSANVLTEDWTELGLYFPWFPYVSEGDAPLTFDLDVVLPSGYRVAGWGEAVETDQGWRLQRKKPVRDIVLVASRDIKTTQVQAEGYRVLVHFTNLGDSEATRLGEEVASALGALGDWFGDSDLREITLVESARESGGGYARSGLIVLSGLQGLLSQEQYPNLLRYLAHEAAHFWWTAAPAETWEDWLNESFAEYSALLLLRQHFGEVEFRDRLEGKRAAAQGTPPIWGFRRSDTSTEEKSAQVTAVLYSAGPLLLNELSERISQPRFLAWCQQLVNQRVASTATGLELLREREGNDVADWFEQRLRGT
jgi:hypothetical protein